MRKARELDSEIPDAAIPGLPKAQLGLVAKTLGADLGMVGRSVVAAVALMIGLHPAPAEADPQSTVMQACHALVGRELPPQSQTLPAGAARVTEAELVSAGQPDSFCAVKGAIEPIDPAAWPVLFQVNLPMDWNGKAIQFGGGGLNGRLVTGLDLHRDAPPGPTALQRGYVTSGTDGGHPVSREIQEFALNDEALDNHAHAAYRKTYDVMRWLIQEYYAAEPRRIYFFGGSEGGREGLVMAQRYPELFDGIVSVVPVLDWVGVNLAGYNQFLLHRAGGAMSPAHVGLWQRAVLEACDTLDGISDGLVARYRGCDEMPAIRSYRCQDGGEGEGCFSDQQLQLIEAYASPYSYSVTLSDGMVDLPRYGQGGEAFPGNIIPMVVSSPDRPDNDIGFPRYSSGDIRYFIARDPVFVGPVDMNVYGERTQEISELMDAPNVDLSAFRSRGGKLILRSNTSDALVPPGSVWRYYERLRDRFGAQTDDFVALYVSPGTSHGGDGRLTNGGAVPSRFDLLAALDNWVEHGALPEKPELAAFAEGSLEPTATLPLCRYPDYPHYNGTGDPREAASYRCTPTNGQQDLGVVR